MTFSLPFRPKVTKSSSPHPTASSTTKLNPTKKPLASALHILRSHNQLTAALQNSSRPTTQKSHLDSTSSGITKAKKRKLTPLAKARAQSIDLNGYKKYTGYQEPLDGMPEYVDDRVAAPERGMDRDELGGFGVFGGLGGFSRYSYAEESNGITNQKMKDNDFDVSSLLTAGNFDFEAQFGGYNGELEDALNRELDLCLGERESNEEKNENA